MAGASLVLGQALLPGEFWAVGSKVKNLAQIQQGLRAQITRKEQPVFASWRCRILFDEVPPPASASALRFIVENETKFEAGDLRSATPAWRLPKSLIRLVSGSPIHSG